MEEIKIGVIDGSRIEELSSVSGVESEKFLEDALVNSPGFPVARADSGRAPDSERGEAHLIYWVVDGDGRLVVFELKRGKLNREAVAQIIDYASSLDIMDLDALAKHISERSGNLEIEKIEDFQSWYTNEFDDFEDLESLKPLRMFLVGLGVDNRTERMVKFLAENSGMDISLLTFYGFNYDGKTLLAKRVEVDGSEAPSPKPKKPSLSREERLEKLLDRAEQYGVPELFNSVRVAFRQNWPESIENTLGQRLGIRLS